MYLTSSPEPLLPHNNNNVHLSCADQRLSAHMIHINLNMIFYTHVEQSPTKTIYIKYYMEKQTHTHKRIMDVAPFERFLALSVVYVHLCLHVL